MTEEQPAAGPEAREPIVVERLSEDEMRALARDLVTNQTYLGVLGHESFNAFEFLTLLGAFREWTEDEVKQVGGMYAPWREASPRSVNGEPRFFGGKVLHSEDVMPLLRIAKVMDEALR